VAYREIVSGQRLSKHVPVAKQQVVNNATAGLQQWKRSVSAWSVPRCYKQGTKSVGGSVLHGRLKNLRR
jgi:hypothetical protein